MSTPSVKESRRSYLAVAAEVLVASTSESTFDAESFIEKFELLAQTPGALLRLREIVYAAAFSGRLTGSSGEYLHNQRLGKFSLSKSIAPEFAFWYFNCEFFRSELARTCTGMKVRHTSPDRILRVPFPLPPLAEQKRIVAKVNQLTALVDELDRQLAESRSKGQQLMKAVVAKLTATSTGSTS